VLNRVYRVWLFRRLAPVLGAEVIITALVLYGIGRVVFVQRVAENALAVFFREPGAIFQFLLGAFVNAPILTRLLAVVFLAGIALVGRGITQGVLRLILVRENYFSRIGK
jgi:hypothetical protein